MSLGPALSAGSAEACPDGYSEFDGTTCFAAHCQLRDAAGARELCANDGGTLAQIDSAEQNDFVAKLLRGCTSRRTGALSDRGFIGLTSEGNDDSSCWYWSQRASNSANYTNYTNWANGEPNNWMNNEDCVVLCPADQNGAGKWTVVTCRAVYFPVCRFDRITDVPPQNQTSGSEQSVNNCVLRQSSSSNDWQEWYSSTEIATVVAKVSGLLSIAGSLLIL